MSWSHFSISCKQMMCFCLMSAPGVSHSRNKKGLTNPRSRNNSPTSNLSFHSLSATLMIFWHTWEDESRKVCMNAFNFRPPPWNFCLVMSQAARKPCFSTLIPRGQNPRFPDGAGAGQTLWSQPDPSPSAPRDEILWQGKPSLLTSRVCTIMMLLFCWPRRIACRTLCYKGNATQKEALEQVNLVLCSAWCLVEPQHAVANSCMQQWRNLHMSAMMEDIPESISRDTAMWQKSQGQVSKI